MVANRPRVPWKEIDGGHKWLIEGNLDRGFYSRIVSGYYKNVLYFDDTLLEMAAFDPITELDTKKSNRRLRR
jgi:hypothetical protein